MAIKPGETLLHYRLIEKIGKGGMGEVWKATDTTLDREVAVKILPDAFASDPQRLARFRREAKVLASLNHPGIASIHGVHESDGTHFLVMELVSGEDLHERLGRGRLSVEEATEIAVQIAEALEAAHASGIVHRDLKPANIKVPAQGRVKILDFGLAKATDLQDPAALETLATAGITNAGVVLGTAAYMSPEQARGQDADTRSDVWSFGCVLWECLTGETLFGGNTPSDSIGAILCTEPEWGKLPADVPSNVRRVLRRCLVKDKDKRIHHIADARIDLADIEGAPEQGESDPGRSGSVRSLRRYWITTLLLFLGLVTTLAMLFGRQVSDPGSGEKYENPLAGAKFTRLTDFPGDEVDAAISQDGRFVGFVSDRDGPFDILVGQIDSQEFRNITRVTTSTHLDIRAPIRNVGFNADGSEIWFLGPVGPRLQMTPLMGGPVRNFLGSNAANVEWSRDGSRIVYHLTDPGDPVFVADHNGVNSSLILESEAGDHQHFPIWSSDGRWIYLVRGRPITGEMDLWRLRPDGSGLERLTDDKRNVTHPAPINERTVLYCAQEPDGSGPWLWVLDVETRQSRRVTYGVETYRSVSVSADGRRAVATVANPRAELWRVPVLDRVATEDDAEPFPVPSLRALAPRFGGDQLFYLSSRGAGDGLWRYQDGESKEIWKGSDTPLLEPPGISPDGDRVVLVLRQEGRQSLYSLSADGAELQLITDQVDVRGTASWSPDGAWLVVGGKSEGTEGLFKISAKGGLPESIVSGVALNPVWSPRGDLIVYTGPQVQALTPLRGVRPDGSPVALPHIEILRETGGGRVRFLPDGRGLVYMGGRTTTQDFYLLDLGTMKSRRLTRFEDPANMRTFDITSDGTEIVFDRLSLGSDLVLIDLNPGGD